MKTKYIKIFAVITPIFIIAVFLGRKLIQDISKSTTKSDKSQKPNPQKKIKVMTPIKRKYSNKLNYFGNLEAFEKVDIYSKIESRITMMSVDVGDNVQEGTILVKLDDSDLVELKKQKEAIHRVALATLKQDRIKIRHKSLVYERARRAFFDKVIPQQELDDAKTEYDLSVAQAQLSQAKVKEAEATIEEVNTRIEDTKIISPMNGIVSTRYLDFGSLVKLNQPIMQLLNINKIKLFVNLPEKDYKEIIDYNNSSNKEIKVNVFIEALNKTFSEKIYKIYPTIDPSTRSTKIEIRFNNPSHILKPGFYCNIIFQKEHQTDSLFIPINAVYYNEVKKTYLIQLIKNNKVLIKEIEVLPYNENDFLIQKGIQQDDQIIIPYNPSLKNGSSISYKLVEKKLP